MKPFEEDQKKLRDLVARVDALEALALRLKARLDDINGRLDAIADKLDASGVTEDYSDVMKRMQTLKTIGPVLTAETLEEIRALLPPNVIRLPRATDDDQVIVECWL
jgi:predicted  nucleic acid-binding Zn-ribbon protein